MVDWDIKWGSIQKIFRLKVHICFRYVDNIRIFLRTINPGWKWSNFGWIWAPKSDDKNTIEHTKEQLKASFQAIFDFLKFTTEDGSEYEDRMLPTLDFKTLELPDGTVRFEYFYKSMENNRVLDRSTALSKGTIFSALRQNLVRRLLNTSTMVGMDRRLLIVERFIQLLVNSGHKYAFIRSIIQQAITKYIYMVQRSRLKKSDEKYQPLYRPPELKAAERIMCKYVCAHIWFKNLDLGDEFRQGWKCRIKNKAGAKSARKNGKSPLKHR